MANIDFVIPVYNEAPGLAVFHRSLAATLEGLGHQARFIYVNDGSTDETAKVLAEMAAGDNRVVTLELSRNFGHQAALSAGLDAADADAVLMMDADGEHPVELAPEMIRLYELGYEVVQTQRLDQARKGFRFKRLTASIFYRLINRLGETQIAEGAADFRLLSGSALSALREIREYHRFYRGMVPWIGFRTVVLPYAPGSRIAGASKYSLRKMMRLARDGMFSFSLAPLRLGLVLGALFLVLAGIQVLYVLSFWLRGEQRLLAPGWSSLMVVLTVGTGIVLLILGILGLYIGMIFQEVKRRPVYLLKDSSLERGPAATPPAQPPQRPTRPEEE
ncbi:MAG: glycosyltransferase family 2 protein [Acidobacteriota bacterium]